MSKTIKNLKRLCKSKYTATRLTSDFFFFNLKNRFKTRTNDEYCIKNNLKNPKQTSMCIMHEI